MLSNAPIRRPLGACRRNQSFEEALNATFQACGVTSKRNKLWVRWKMKEHCITTPLLCPPNHRITYYHTAKMLSRVLCQRQLNASHRNRTIERAVIAAQSLWGHVTDERAVTSTTAKPYYVTTLLSYSRVYRAYSAVVASRCYSMPLADVRRVIAIGTIQFDEAVTDTSRGCGVVDWKEVSTLTFIDNEAAIASILLSIQKVLHSHVVPVLFNISSRYQMNAISFVHRSVRRQRGYSLLFMIRRLFPFSPSYHVL